MAHNKRRPWHFQVLDRRRHSGFSGDTMYISTGVKRERGGKKERNVDFFASNSVLLWRICPCVPLQSRPWKPVETTPPCLESLNNSDWMKYGTAIKIPNFDWDKDWFGTVAGKEATFENWRGCVCGRRFMYYFKWNEKPLYRLMEINYWRGP